GKYLIRADHDVVVVLDKVTCQLFTSQKKGEEPALQVQNDWMPIKYIDKHIFTHGMFIFETKKEAENIWKIKVAGICEESFAFTKEAGEPILKFSHHINIKSITFSQPEIVKI